MRLFKQCEFINITTEMAHSVFHRRNSSHQYIRNDQGTSFHSHFASLMEIFICSIFFYDFHSTHEDKKGNKNPTDTMVTEDCRGVDLREGPLKSSPCGTDDFSKGTEGLSQKVLEEK